MGMMPLAAPDLGEAEAQAVLDVVRSGWLTMGPRTADFEAAFAGATGARHAVMVSSGTAALHLAFLALELGPGDEVIVPSLSFVATANAVAYTGATPRFADIASLERPLMDPEAVRALIGPRTAAICAVHYAGYVGFMGELRELAERHGLALVEDAAHAPGARGPEGTAGALGDLGCFSFFSNKNLVTGEGGMVTTGDDALAARLRLLRAHGMTATSWDRERGHANGYDVIARGYNYRPSELEAALGLVQLAKLEGNAVRRRALVAEYRAALAATPDVGRVPFGGEDDLSSCHIVPIVAPSHAAREALRGAAADGGVMTSVHYSPIHRFSIFGEQPELPLTEEFGRRELTVPLHPGMSPADVARVTEVLAGAPALVSDRL